LGSSRRIAGSLLSGLLANRLDPKREGQDGGAKGVIEPADVIGPEAQGIAPGEFDELVRAMKAGVTYANVHSELFPGGEIRGQIHKR
jgi:hypothetical protein